MYGTAAAMWLDSTFAGYDHFFLNICHFLGDKLGFLLTPLAKLITFLGEKGILFFLLAICLMLLADERDLGVCIFGAVCCGALITNIILKDMVMRIRPFETGTIYTDWWMAIGAPPEEDYSFPSGHVTACTAAMTALTLMRGKKWLVPSLVVVFLMGFSRNYLMAHYPSDVLFAVLIGVFSGVVAWLITQWIFRFLKRNQRRIPVCGVLLDFDVRDYLPVSLPILPIANRKAKAPAPRRPAVDTGDEDVKTYTGRRAAQAPAAAAEEAPARKGRHETAESSTAPTLVGRSSGIRDLSAGGRHSAEPGSTARRISIPGTYEGKHVKK